MNATMVIMSKYEVTPEQAREFQRLLINARKAKGLSQTEAGREAGVSQALISSLENGPHDGMRFFDAMKVFKYYGFYPNQIASLLGLLPDEPNISEEERTEIRRLIRSFGELPNERKGEALRMIEIILEGYRRS